jgi:sensor histidine kinase YesM
MKHILYLFSFFWVFACFSLSIAVAQQPIFVHLTEKEGLPDKEFYNVLEDDNGFIWFAADKGLYRYDGKEFKLFPHPDQVGLSVFSLKKDVDNTIWYTNLANQVFHVKGEEVTLFLNLKEYFSGDLPRIFLHDDLLILATIRTLIIIDKKTKEILYKTTSKKNLFNSNAFIHNDAICFFDDEGNLITIDKHFQLHQKASKLNYNARSRISVYVDEISGMYVFMKRHLNMPNEYIVFNIDASNEIQIHSSSFLERELVHKIRSIDDALFVASDNGVYVYQTQQEKLIEKERFLQNVSVSDVLKDSKGNVWFTTLYEGIYVMPNLKLNINFQIPNGNTIRRLYKGKSNELFLIGKQKEFYLFNHDTKATQAFVKEDVADIKYMFFDDQKSLYYLQTTKALEALKIKTNTLTFYEKYFPGIVKDHAIINKDTVLLATGAAIVVTSLRNTIHKKLERFYNERVRAYSCYYNSQTQQSYFGTVKGLFVLDKNFKKNEILHREKTIFIKDMVSSTDGSLWCLSFKNGIYQIRNNQVVKNIKVHDGLLSNLNSFIRCDEKNNFLWIAGDKGLQRYNITTETFKNLTKKQGIPSYEFTGLELIDQNVYVSTLDQLFSFDSKTVFSERTTQKPIPYFSSVKINDVATEILTNYTLPYDNEKIEIAFNTNGFLSSETVTYEYRLVTNAQDNIAWQEETSRNNKVIYNKLSEGKYSFQLRAKNADQTSEIITLQFTVEGIFYQQWWFYVLGTFGICMLIWNYFRKQNKRLQEKQQLLLDKQSKELENIFLKLESLRSQMNPHFIFNALNSIQDYILHNEKKLARTYLVKFSRLIRLYLEHSQKDVISLEEELIALNLYLQLEKDRFEDSFQYEILMDENIPTEQIFMPTFLLQPYVENAIKHGLLHKKNNRALQIHLQRDENTQLLKCVIDDNGIGREASAVINHKKPFYPTSFSSDANEKRIELLNKTRKSPIVLNIEDKKDAKNNALGTKVTILIPLA